MRFLLFCVSLVSISSQSIYAAESLSTKIQHHYSSMRALGMGDAFTAVADDYSLIYYNPAGFAYKKQNEIQFSMVGLGVSPKTITLTNDIKKASETKGTDQQKALAISNVLEEYYGKSLGGKVQAVELFWVRKNWGFSIIPVDLSIDMTIDRQLGPSIDLNIKGDSTAAFGMGYELTPHFAMGFTAKYVHRVSVEQSVSALELATDSNVLSTKRFKEGQSIDADLGFLYKPNWFGTKIVKEEVKEKVKVEIKDKDTKSDAQIDKKTEIKEDLKNEKRDPQSVAGSADATSSDSASNPDALAETEVKKPQYKEVEKTVIKDKKVDDLPLTLGLVVHNVLGGNFAKSKMVNKDATETPTRMYSLIDVGSQYVISELGDLTIRSMIDFKDIMYPGLTVNKSLHAGIEFDYSPSGWFKAQFRGGINQMYYTAGTTLLLGIFNIDLVSYGEEVGTTSTKLENRVYAAKFGMNF